MEKISVVLAAAFPPKLSNQQAEAAEMLLRRPDIDLPNGNQLDRLLECESLPDCLYGEGFGFEEPFNWLQDVLESLGWWVHLGNRAMESPVFKNEGNYGPNLSLSDRRKDLAGLLAKVMEAYPIANDEIAVCGMEGGPFPATVELMRRYRLYTRQIEALVFDVWPGINRDLLTSPEFFKGPSAGTGKPHVEYVN